MTIEQLVRELSRKGGAIVSSNDCTAMEISFAQADGRFAVDDDSMGYVLRFPEWLKLAQESIRGRASTPLDSGHKGTPSDKCS